MTSWRKVLVEDGTKGEKRYVLLVFAICTLWPHFIFLQVEQNNIPGIDATYLAMDTEEGVEVVWNEVRFSERKYFKAKEEIISEVFDRLIQLEHPNIVKLHKYWIQKDADVPKVVFITEYMSSGSLKQYFKKTKRHDIKLSLQVFYPNELSNEFNLNIFCFRFGEDGVHKPFLLCVICILLSLQLFMEI